MTDLASWGRWPAARQSALRLRSRHDPLPAVAGSMLPRGLGRSYGDSCLNDGGTLLLTQALDRFVSFDAQAGRLACEAGVSFDEILRLIVPRGWFLPVTPGTRFISVGGAIANDVHGKNHHVAGTFGRHVSRLWLRRSDGEVRELSAGDPLFGATVGGLGLTGVIVAAEFTLRRVESADIVQDVLKFRGLDEFLHLSRESSTYEYSVAWLDGLHGRDARGVFFRGRHAEATGEGLTARGAPLALRVPLAPPGSLLNRLTVQAFNTAYFHGTRTRGSTRLGYRPFFYPLDGVEGWNRLYGPGGFLQWQCVVPQDPEALAIRTLLRDVGRAGSASFLSVLKVFGDVPSPGLLSFPRPGVTLALDFPMRGAETLRLLDRLDATVMDAGGAIYPAKDARMSPATFRRSFPRLDEFRAHLDPRLSSSFWRRVGTEA